MLIFLYIFKTDRSSHRRCSVRKGVLRNFAKFTGKYLCQSLILKKVAGLRLYVWSQNAILLNVYYRIYVWWTKKASNNAETRILRAVSSRQYHVLAFLCHVLVCFVIHVLFLAMSNELMQSVRVVLPNFTKLFGKQSDGVLS